MKTQLVRELESAVYYSLISPPSAHPSRSLRQGKWNGSSVEQPSSNDTRPDFETQIPKPTTRDTPCLPRNPPGRRSSLSAGGLRHVSQRFSGTDRTGHRGGCTDIR